MDKFLARAFLHMLREWADSTETKIDDHFCNMVRAVLIERGLIDDGGPDDVGSFGGGGSGP